VASTSSSTKKAAKLAQKGKGKKVRFQGGTIFPLAVALTLILGFGLIVYARQSLPAADSTPPTVNDHWHAAYGFYLCDTWYQLAGNLEEQNAQGSFVNTKFLQSGIHSHDDGVMHWHPYTSKAVGRNATIGVFLDTYDVELTDDSIKFPEVNALGGKREYIEGETKCGDEDAEISVVSWTTAADSDDGNRYIAAMDKVHVDSDGMVFAIIFGTDDAPRVMPPSAADLTQLSLNDTQQIRPEDLLQTDPSVVVGSDTGDSATGGSATADSATADSATASSGG
jgi:hypothetical protein